MTLSLAIIIPVYNEENSIVHTVERVKAGLKSLKIKMKTEIICVNDGSHDGSKEILESIKDITVIHHHANRGYGAALKTALDYTDKEWIFIVDADGSYPIEDMGKLADQINEHTHMIVGAREGIGISKHPFRRFARWLLRSMVKSLTGVMVPDLNSGMRFFRKSLYDQFHHLLPMGFSFTTTITVASLYSGYDVKYIPINYNERVGKSNIRPADDFFNFTVLIIRLASYFEPLRFFIPLSLIIYLVAFLRGVRDVLLTNAIGSLAIIIFLVAIQVFVAGIIVDVVVRRSMGLKKGASADVIKSVKKVKRDAKKGDGH